jgi:hypothetical protein
MAKSKFNELDKIIFVRWVDRSLDQSLIKQTIKVGFRVITIWPFNLKIMDEKKKLANPRICYKVNQHNMNNYGIKHWLLHEEPKHQDYVEMTCNLIVTNNL